MRMVVFERWSHFESFYTFLSIVKKSVNFLVDRFIPTHDNIRNWRIETGQAGEGFKCEEGCD